MDRDEGALDEDDTIQDVPIILSPELRDVFPIFVNMLDIKSFTNLAMTSKDMYKECMENKFIEIIVDEDTVTMFMKADDSINFDFTSSIVRRWHPHKKRYLDALCQPQYTVNLNTVNIYADFENDVISATRRYLEEKNVNRIKEVTLDRNPNEWEELISFLKDFKVELLHMSHARMPPHALRSILQLNLEEFDCDQLVGAVVLLGTNSPIRNIRLELIGTLSGDEFMQLLLKIQSGSLIGVKIHMDSVNVRPYKELSFDHEGALPEDRPLLIRRWGQRHNAEDCWILHWNGRVTALHKEGHYRKLHKCEPIDYPWMLRDEEDILKDLTKRRPRVFCSSKQFQTFLASLMVVDSSHEGPLPEERPLCCKVSNTRFWMLDEDDSLTQCTWENGCAMWEPFNISDKPEGFAHQALAKYMFWKLLRTNADVPFGLYCKNKEELDSWLEDFQKLRFDYAGPLPTERPVVFEGIVSDGGKSKKIFVLLLEEHVLQCELVGKEVAFMKCEARNRPAILMTADIIKELLEDSLSRSRRFKDMGSVYVNRKTFLDGFELFKTSPIEFLCIGKEPYFYERTTMMNKVEERWYGVDRRIAKATWENGCLHFPYCHLNELPFEFVKKSFIPLAQMGYPDDFVKDNLFLVLEKFNSCLEQFTVVPFDYSGPLTSDSPLAFVKKEIRHTCNGAPTCPCSKHFIRVFFLWKDMTTTYCSWAEKTAYYIDFRGSSFSSKVVPLVMKSKEYLEVILQKMLNIDGEYEWFGSFDDVITRLKEYKTLPYDYDGPLPEERPLVFEDKERKLSRFILRDDGKFVECKWHSDRVWFQLRYDRWQ